MEEEFVYRKGLPKKRKCPLKECGSTNLHADRFRGEALCLDCGYFWEWEVKDVKKKYTRRIK